MADLVEKKILENGQTLFEGVERIVLAVSGGADSVAMAHALVHLRQQGRLPCDFVIGHVNHCLRGAESDADEAFVRELAGLLSIPSVTKAVDVAAYAKAHKLSIETAGRQMRLRMLEEIAQDHGCGCIATAHHADDQAETLIHRLMRGSGFRGLCGIKPVSVLGGVVYIRPMLAIRRAEILQYCADHEIPWRQDKSNSDLRFTRNRIRHQLLPHLQANSDLTDSLIKLTAAAQDLQQRVDEGLENSISELYAGEKGFQRVSFHQERLRDCSPWIFYELIRQGIVTLGGGLRDYTRSHFDAIGEMTAQSRAKADFPGSLEVIVENQTVMIQRKGYVPSRPEQDEVVLVPDETVRFGMWKVTSRLFDADRADVKRFLTTKDNFIEWFDADKVVGPLILRCRRDGDRFWPIGAPGSKKVARFLIDAQMCGNSKKETFLVVDSEKVLWVAPVRMCEPAKVTCRTHKILQISIER